MPDTASAAIRGVAFVTARRGPRAAQLGVTPDEYARMLTAQGGHCALCPGKPKTRRLHVHHHHKSGIVLGLLCWQCQRAIPYYVSSDWFERAAILTRRGEVTAPDSGTPAAAVIDPRVVEMRELRAAGSTLQSIADRYGISRQRVHQIIRGAS